MLGLTAKVHAGSGLFGSRLLNLGKAPEKQEVVAIPGMGVAEWVFRDETAQVQGEEPQLLKKYPPEVVEVASVFRALVNTRLRMKMVAPSKDVEVVSGFAEVMRVLTPPPRKGFTEGWDWRDWASSSAEEDHYRELIGRVVESERDFKALLVVLAGLEVPRSVIHDRIVRFIPYTVPFKARNEIIQALHYAQSSTICKVLGERQELPFEFGAEDALCRWIMGEMQGDSSCPLIKHLDDLKRERKKGEEPPKPGGSSEGELAAARATNELFKPMTREIHLRPSKVEIPWGTLKMAPEELAPSPEHRKKVRAFRSTDAGSQIGRIERVLMDGRVFRESRPAQRGSLLVDCSGSMGMGAEDVRMVLKHVPGATVGLYSGRGEVGVLRVIARGGKIAPKLQDLCLQALRLGGNVVDGPALEWLATQPEPRVWYSDGRITGVGDAPNAYLAKEVDGICRRGRIVRIDSDKAVASAFAVIRKALRLTNYVMEE